MSGLLRGLSAAVTAVVHEVSVAKINEKAPLDKVRAPNLSVVLALCKHAQTKLLAPHVNAVCSFSLLFSQVCLLGCGVSTGWGAVFNTAKARTPASALSRPSAPRPCAPPYLLLPPRHSGGARL